MSRVHQIRALAIHVYAQLSMPPRALELLGRVVHQHQLHTQAEHRALDCCPRWSIAARGLHVALLWRELHFNARTRELKLKDSVRVKVGTTVVLFVTRLH